ncbi:hypothetical protein MMKA1_08080 [Methanococcus maripaludis KA1]|uniref:DEAD/DEAH-box helicase domain-containing protein n=2 Tax=Methanococcus maripaludis TaxID=39152 RepID=A0A2Z5PHS3_METMI|nr:hypothetical protein MMKA1_08080 [Methanococcus maripaludis KA1]
MEKYINFMFKDQNKVATAIRLVPINGKPSGYAFELNGNHYDRNIDEIIKKILKKELVNQYNYYINVYPINLELISKGDQKKNNFYSKSKHHFDNTNIVYFEIDVIKKDNNANCEEYLKNYLQNMPKPSMIVFTGNGYHIYYKLDEFYKYSELNSILKKYVTYDKKHEKIINGGTGQYILNPRLRLPGTCNFKKNTLNETVKKECRIVELNDLRYNKDELFESIEEIIGYKPFDDEEVVSEKRIGSFSDYIEATRGLSYNGAIDIREKMLKQILELCKKYQMQISGGKDKLENILKMIGYEYENKGNHFKIDNYGLDTEGGDQVLLIYPNGSFAKTYCNYVDDQLENPSFLQLLYIRDIDSFKKILEIEGLYSEFYNDLTKLYHSEIHGINIPKVVFDENIIDIDPNISKKDLIKIIDMAKKNYKLPNTYITKDMEITKERYKNAYFQHLNDEEFEDVYHNMSTCADQALSYNTEDIETLKIDQYIPVNTIDYIFNRIDEKCNGKQKEICMLSPTGSGKTTAIFNKFISNNENKTILAVPYLSNSKQLGLKYKNQKGIVALYENSKISQEKLNSANFIVTTYDQIGRLAERKDISEFNLYVDEAHNVVLQHNFRNQALDALNKVSKLVNRTIYVTATNYNLNYKKLPIIKIIQKNKRFKYDDISVVDSNVPLKLLIEAVLYDYEDQKESGKTQIIFNNNKEQNRKIKARLEEQGIICALLDAESKESIEYTNVMEEEKLPENLDVCICTSAIADGVNIENLNIGNLHIHKIDNFNTFLQFIARFRNGCQKIYLYVDLNKQNPKYISKENFENDVRKNILDMLHVINSDIAKYSDERIRELVLKIHNSVSETPEILSTIEEYTLSDIKKYHLKSLEQLLSIYPEAYKDCVEIADINEILALKTSYEYGDRLLTYDLDAKKYVVNEITVMKKYSDYISKQVMNSKIMLHMMINRCDDLEKNVNIVNEKEYTKDEKSEFTTHINNRRHIYHELEKAYEKDGTALKRIAYEDDKTVREVMLRKNISQEAVKLANKKSEIIKYVTIINAEDEGILEPEKRMENYNKGNRGLHKLKENIILIKNLSVFKNSSKHIKNLHNVCAENARAYTNYILYTIYENIVNSENGKKVDFLKIRDRLNSEFEKIDEFDQISIDKIKEYAKQFGNIARWDDKKGIGYFKSMNEVIFKVVKSKQQLKDKLKEYSNPKKAINETLEKLGGKAKTNQILRYIKDNYVGIDKDHIESIKLVLDSGIFIKLSSDVIISDQSAMA